MVVDLLNVTENHACETNPMSKHFVKIVCSLFTSRESVTDEKGEKKVQKFSPLILSLEEKEENDTDEKAQRRVIDVISRCFNVCRNAMVGQQLARYYYIVLKDYTSAEDTIKQCLLQLPHNSYLLDTYGQIFKTKMEQSFSNLVGKKMANCEAAECINLASKAVEKFQLAQEASTQYEENAAFNSNSFYMEVMTALSLLEHFHKFECYKDKESFWKFLNEDNICLETSPYKEIVALAPTLETFKKKSEIQHHLEMSLRTLEERAYMARHLTTVFTPSGDTLLLRPREKFEMFYGSKEHTSQFEFLFGVGLKLLMKAHTDKESRGKFEKRVKEAERRLEKKDFTEQERDLLVYLGYNIIRLSTEEINASLSLYRRLLNYSTDLWKIQRNKNAKDRKYVEAYLYYALLHWILPGRSELGIEGLSHPETYSVLLKEWEETYMINNHIRNREQLFKEKPKIFFAIGNGSHGNDIVDLEWLRHLWREAMSKQGRTRKEVKADNHWQHPIFEERLARLNGTVDSNGRRISTEVCFNKRNYTFKIRTNEYYEPLKNRAVTFVLAFSWMDPVALDVRKHDKYFKRQNSQRSPENTQENWFQNYDNNDELARQDTNLRNLSTLPKEQRPSSRGHHKKAAYSKSESQVTKKTFSMDDGDGQSNSKNSSLRTDGFGRGRGRGIRSQAVAPTGTRSTFKEATAADHDSSQLNRDRKNMKTCIPDEKGPLGVFKTESFESKHKPDTGNDQKEKKSFAAVGNDSPATPWSNIAGSSISASGQSSTINMTRTKTCEGNVFTEDVQDIDEIDKEWTTVKKKSRSVKKENQNIKAHISAPRLSSAYTSKQERFEELLIKKCQERYPHVSRSKLINAYKDVKSSNSGNLTGIRMENIIEEIGKHLKH
ncbi:uncharacterized protein LOC132731997 isoform X2 [Ruditapes philippinarum]|uniref:uncharacterized protein LOC132731997 isoform X2 n=1 Tax=Ruditapes philippinarum TaxID=129788 RepID=UPI00295BBA55|nr:uncharacterized protein LOC132731997 isoform X2 [Ruditapes philippinarum]